MGDVKLYKVDKHNNKIWVEDKKCGLSFITPDGKFSEEFDGECIIFPAERSEIGANSMLRNRSLTRRHLNHLTRYLLGDSDGTELVSEQDETRWKCALYSHERGNESIPYKYATTDSPYVYCIPYNEETKHLVGTADEAPEYYRYWED